MKKTASFSSDLMSTSELSDAKLLVGPRARLKHFLVLILFFVGLIVCVTSLTCILLLPSFVSNQISKVSNRQEYQPVFSR